MTTGYKEVMVQTNQAEQFALELFGIEGQAQFLPGEIDLNFKISGRDNQHYILKISRPGAILEFIDYQQNLLSHLVNFNLEFEHPKPIPDLDGNLISQTVDSRENIRFVRLLTWVSGHVYSNLNPKTDELRFSLGSLCGRLTKALSGFSHPQAKRQLDWDIAQGLWTQDFLHLFTPDKKEVVTYFLELFKKNENSFSKLRKGVVHNDANDNNIIVSDNLILPEAKALIDFGDAVYTQVINDLAVACSYAALDLEDPLEGLLPLVEGYHKTHALQADELEYLYTCIGIRLVISVTKSAINKIEEPDNDYLQITDKAAWKLLFKWKEVNATFAHFSFRSACDFEAHPNQSTFLNWSLGQKFDLLDLFPAAGGNEVLPIDLSVGSTWLGLKEDFVDFSLFDFKIERLQGQNPDKIIAGGYLEARTVYGTSAYDKQGNSGPESRTIHLGIDFWFPPNTPVHALFDGEVVIAMNDAGDKEYGGLVILRHEVENFHFYTLYGHLTVASATSWKIGDVVAKGDRIALLGNYPENGNWPSHLHFQIMLSMLEYEVDFPGVAYPNQAKVFSSICPDPNLLFKGDALQPYQPPSEANLIEFRQSHLGKGLSLSYQDPLFIVRGSGAYLFDAYGRKYLDTVNNVAHVGHEHHRVVRAGQNQMAVLNTNTRYLHANIQSLAEELQKTLPPQLSVFHFVNSGSEANELALRMIKTATGHQEVLASEMGYHGNTNTCVEVSSYKFDGKGGPGCPEHTHVFPLPDPFRGKYQGTNTAGDYAKEVADKIDAVESSGQKIAGLILEPIISCGGQIELPEGFLKLAYASVRKAGGYCISDEVQVGCGRLGSTFWGFEQHGVIPDLITIGKPLGNGHPVAAVVCTLEVAERFANGMEFFTTFGGNPVSCAIATEVLKTVYDEGLQQQALEVGGFLKEKLQKLSKSHPVISDIRGQGLFLGVELTDTELKPESEKAAYLVNRMKQRGILMSLDGPDHNVIKIKPPLVFSIQNAVELIRNLKLILAEDYMN